MELSTTEARRFALIQGDILFNRTNSAELVGKTAVFDGAQTAIFASYLIRFRPDIKQIRPEFMSAYINSPQGRRFIEANMARAIGQVNISASTMHKMPIPAPPLAVQDRIVTLLAEQARYQERLSDATEAQLATIGSLPQAILSRAFRTALI